AVRDSHEARLADAYGTGSARSASDCQQTQTGRVLMIVATKPVYRAIAIGVAAAALLIGSFLLGSTRSGASSAVAGSTAASNSRAGRSGVVLTSSAAGGKITVTGTGTVSGTPNQLVLSMGVQTSASSVSTALQEANQAARRVISSLKAGGVRAADIQT